MLREERPCRIKKRRDLSSQERQQMREVRDKKKQSEENVNPGPNSNSVDPRINRNKKGTSYHHVYVW